MVAPPEDETLRQLLADATAESVELSGQTEASDLGPATLEHLDLAVERLGLIYMTTPPAVLLDELGWYRRRAKEVLGGRHTLAQRRRLYVAAGWLTGLLGHLSFDLATIRPPGRTASRPGSWPRTPVSGSLPPGSETSRRWWPCTLAGSGRQCAMPRRAENLPPPERRAVCSCRARRTSARPAWPPMRDRSGCPTSRGGLRATSGHQPARERLFGGCGQGAVLRWDRLRLARPAACRPSFAGGDQPVRRCHRDRSMARQPSAGPPRSRQRACPARRTGGGQPDSPAGTAIFSERPVDSVMRRARDLEAVLDVQPYRQLPAVRQFREQLQITCALRPNRES